MSTGINKITIVKTDDGTVGVYYNGKLFPHQDGDDVAYLLHSLGYAVNIALVTDENIEGGLPALETDLQPAREISL